MNNDQRKYLISKVEETYKKQKEAIEKDLMDKPSLNNYLVASFLDDTVEFNDLDVLKKKLRKMVLEFGTSDKLVDEDSYGGYNNYSRTKSNKVKITAEDLFIIPELYKKALAKYEEIKKDVEARVTKLHAEKETIVMKLQIGSPKALDSLITEVDNLADISIFNSQFLLIEPKKK